MGWVVVWWFCGGDSLGETPSILFEPGELSPVVLMVLHLGGCGRVDGCRNIFCEWGSPGVGALSFFCAPKGGGGFSVGVLRACVGVFWGLHKKPEHFGGSVLEPYYALGSPSRLLTGCISKKYSPYGTSGAHSPSL